MKMPDVNVLVYAHRAETTEHKLYAAWVTQLAESEEQFALSELVAHGFIRIVTNPRIFKPASTIAQAFAFLESLLSLENCSVFRPGDHHFEIFRELCFATNAKGKLVADAYHAALAIEFGCCWVSADSDFVRFEKRLTWEHLC